jgi:ribosomal protein S18 acetylase RimI-like enzyme
VQLRYERGAIEDVPWLAQLIDLASDGIIDHLYRDLIPGITPTQAVAFGLKNEDSPYSYKSAIVVRDRTDILGMALSYHSSHHVISNEMRMVFPAERLSPLERLYTPKIQDGWFLDALCVTQSARRKGVGQRLIELTKDEAIERGCDVMSLIVFADNGSAIRLYERTGFAVSRAIEVPSGRYIRHNDGCLLMTCALGSSRSPGKLTSKR